MENFPRVKVHDLGIRDGSNSKRECKCIDCENLRARVKSIFKPWYKKVYRIWEKKKSQ